MHLRHLSLLTFAAPLLIVACSSDEGASNDVGPAFGTNPPVQSTDPLQGPGENPGEPPANMTPPVDGTPGNNEGPPSTDTPLQPVDDTGSDPGSSNPGSSDPGTGAGGAPSMEPNPPGAAGAPGARKSRDRCEVG